MSIFECSHCGKKFGKQMSLKGHVLSCHPSEISKNQELLYKEEVNDSKTMAKVNAAGRGGVLI